MDTNIFKEITIALTKDDAMGLTVFLDQNHFQGMHGYYEVLFDENKSGADPDHTQLVLYFSADDDEADIRIEILLAALGIESIYRSEKNITKTEYLEAYKKHYTSFFISPRIQIVPSWEKEKTTDDPGSGNITLYLDPGLAFGTGLHPTTKMCMNYLDLNPPESLRVIDAGCGSGILSIGAVLLGAKEIFAFDVDGNAVLAVKGNLELNSGCEDKIILRQGGFDLPQFAEYPADIMFGNLTANVILSNKKYIESGKFSVMMLSGILEEKETEVIDEFSDKWNCVHRDHLDGWSLLILRKK